MSSSTESWLSEMLRLQLSMTTILWVDHYPVPRLCHIWTPPVLQAGFTTVRAGLLSYIRLRDGTVFVPSLDGFRAAAPMHPDGLMGQPMTRLRFCCCGGDHLRPSVRVSCYAILGSASPFSLHRRAHFGDIIRLVFVNECERHPRILVRQGHNRLIHPPSGHQPPDPTAEVIGFLPHLSHDRSGPMNQ